MKDSETDGRSRRWARPAITVVLVALLVLAWLAARREWIGAPEPRVVVLYGFSTLDDVIGEGIAPAFQRRWRESRGETVEFVTTFAASGEIIDRLIARYPAELAIVPSELDAHRLPVPWRSWRAFPHGGVVARTPLVIVVRAGNPEGITGWADLARPGLELVHANPATSGLAALAILAGVGLEQREDLDREERLRQIWTNVVAQPASAREAHRLFESGVGDALIAYEHDALGSRSRRPIEGEIVYPEATIVAEPVLTLIEKNISERQQPLASALAEFLWSEDAQAIFADYGFRPVSAEPGGLPTGRPELVGALTLEDFGGAPEARRTILEEIWRKRVLPSLGHAASPNP